MSAFVESLKRLYNRGFVTTAKLNALVREGKLTQAEYDYIVGA